MKKIARVEFASPSGIPLDKRLREAGSIHIPRFTFAENVRAAGPATIQMPDYSNMSHVLIAGNSGTHAREAIENYDLFKKWVARLHENQINLLGFSVGAAAIYQAVTGRQEPLDQFRVGWVNVRNSHYQDSSSIFRNIPEEVRVLVANRYLFKRGQFKSGRDGVLEGRLEVIQDGKTTGTFLAYEGKDFEHTVTGSMAYLHADEESVPYIVRQHISNEMETQITNETPRNLGLQHSYVYNFLNS